jgi:hypothetical protein
VCDVVVPVKEAQCFHFVSAGHAYACQTVNELNAQRHGEFGKFGSFDLLKLAMRYHCLEHQMQLSYLVSISPINLWAIQKYSTFLI